MLITLLILVLGSAVYLLTRKEKPAEQEVRLTREMLDLWESLRIIERKVMDDGCWGVRLIVTHEEAHRILREDFLRKQEQIIMQMLEDEMNTPC